MKAWAHRVLQQSSLALLGGVSLLQDMMIWTDALKYVVDGKCPAKFPAVPHENVLRLAEVVHKPQQAGPVALEKPGRLAN